MMSASTASLDCAGIASKLNHLNADAARQWMRSVVAAARAYPDPAVWTFLLPEETVIARLDEVWQRRLSGQTLPLLGMPFAVKDNIDVAGCPTTAACPRFAYSPEKSAAAVQRLLDAGAILIGKTNLDQFATGLVGTRSPYGACRNPFDGRYISGGSSSGSAVAVAAGLVSFALGTDTAGSGRVPAGFNNIVGFKPTRGLVSTSGVVPACRSLDCVSIFAATCDDAARVFGVLRGYDSTDAFSRKLDDVPSPRAFNPANFRLGVPSKSDLRFFGNGDVEAKFAEAIGHLRRLGGTIVEIDYSPFANAARLLYEGPWLAERFAAVGDFLKRMPEALLAVTRSIIERGEAFDAVSAFRGIYALESLKQEARAAWDRIDVLLVPTAGTIYTIEEVTTNPVELNINLGYYTNFANLMDLSAIAVPNGFQGNGLPTGVTLLARAGEDRRLFTLGDALHRATSTTIGAMGNPLPVRVASTGVEGVQLAVVGAHLSGQPLNWQLTQRGAQLVRTCRTSGDYRLFALPGTIPPKPGLVRSNGAGVPLEVEVWLMSVEAFGSFVAAIPPPLGMGTVRLEDGEDVKGFLCEQYATTGAEDISHFGGWRKYLTKRN